MTKVNPFLHEAIRTAALRQKNVATNIAEVLVSLDEEFPGLGYDVGIWLMMLHASKMKPGPSPSWHPQREGGLSVTAFDPSRKNAAWKALRTAVNFGASRALRVLRDLQSCPGEPVQILVSRPVWQVLEVQEVLQAAGFTVTTDPNNTPPKSHRAYLAEICDILPTLDEAEIQPEKSNT